MDLRRLPNELVGHIESYVQPYRVYKKEEADLITWHGMATEYYIEEGYFPDVKEWSLYGKMWLVRAPESVLYARRRPLTPPPPYTESLYESPLEWYQYSIQWLDGLVRLDRLGSALNM